ncbi:MAG: TetR family transcriptional regulator [Pseudomonadales bacterium]
MNSAPVSRTPVRRDAEATRRRIMESAGNLFTAKGYDGAGLREICSAAGVDQALIKRYFGSKQQLFEAIFNSEVGLDALLQGPKEELGLRLAKHFAAKKRSGAGFDATIAMLHSIGSPEVSEHIKHILESQFINKFAAYIGGRHAKQRSALIISALMGFDVLKRVVEVDALGTRHRATIIKTWATQIQGLVDA